MKMSHGTKTDKYVVCSETGETSKSRDPEVDISY